MSEEKDLEEVLEEQELEQQPIEETEQADQEQALKQEQEPEKDQDSQNPVEALKEELAALDDKYKRSLADFDNFRRRTVKEKANMYDDGVRATVEKILPVLDNFERAAMAANEESSLKQGVEMVLKQFIDILSAIGVSEIEAQDKQFDPNLHLAVMHIEDENYGENTIVEVLQKGYMYKEKVIRYSTVKVAN